MQTEIRHKSRSASSDAITIDVSDFYCEAQVGTPDGIIECMRSVKGLLGARGLLMCGGRSGRGFANPIVVLKGAAPVWFYLAVADAIRPHVRRIDYLLPCGQRFVVSTAGTRGKGQ